MVHQRAYRRHGGRPVGHAFQCRGNVLAERVVSLLTRYSAKVEKFFSHLLEHPELSQQPPQQQEDENGAEAAPAEFFCTVPGSESA